LVAQWVIAAVIAVTLQVAAYLITPKPKAPKPEAARDAEAPVAEAGKPQPVVFGTIEVKGLNVLWHGDKSVRTYEVDA
jgi:hypothetical protein